VVCSYGPYCFAALEQPRIHFPEPALFFGTLSRKCRLERQFVGRFKRQVELGVAELARLDVVSLNLRIRIVGVACAVRALVVCEFDHRQLRCFAARLARDDNDSR
jgi:hypothetical protein